MSSSNKQLNTIDTETGKVSKFEIQFPVAKTSDGLINICKYGAFAIKDNKVCAFGSSASVLGANPCVDFGNKEDAQEALNRIAEVLHKCGKAK